MTLSRYEQEEWARLQQRKAAVLRRPSKRLLPAKARDRLSAAADKARTVPGAELVTAGYTTAARGLGKATGSTATRTMSSKYVIKQYQRAGHGIENLDGVRQLDLSAVDAVAKLGRVRYGHSVLAAAGGFGSGAVVTGGEVLAGAGTVAGAGAGAAPGLGTVAVAMLADAAGVLGLAARSVAATALYYGYDPRRPEEEIFMMSVIGLGMASGTTAKTAAYAELSQLTQLLVRGAPWAKLNEKVLTRIAQQFATKFGQTLTKKKLGQFVPVAGMVVGAGLNYWVIDQISVAAYDAYRERFLIEKSGGEFTATVDRAAPPAQDDDVIDVLGLLRDEDALPPPEPREDSFATEDA